MSLLLVFCFCFHFWSLLSSTGRLPLLSCKNGMHNCLLCNTLYVYCTRLALAQKWQVAMQWTYRLILLKSYRHRFIKCFITPLTLMSSLCKSQACSTISTIWWSLATTSLGCDSAALKYTWYSSWAKDLTWNEDMVHLIQDINKHCFLIIISLL